MLQLRKQGDITCSNPLQTFSNSIYRPA